MKAVWRSIALGLLLSGLQAGTGLAAPATFSNEQVSPSDYYSGLATGQGYRSHWASQYGEGTPQYTAAIDAEYLRASRAVQAARQNGDTHEEDFWLGFIDGLERAAEEEV
ncbi:hypothetical protein [Hymenobacter swuensis]|uniref:Secreted protein n=1 Tax=Hymenobacter swuensis DY53 TaxID=1227739 RepID=W8F7X6_9BACT|nr:hypothetical protein [Hymenobacter swuensis]AHJ97835.1 hypothetical protein Hsw_2240 [Hymenobacter swuensis DY53]